MKWISVKDSLPTQPYVLVINDHNEIEVGSYEILDGVASWRIGHDCVGWDYDFNKDYTVNFWMLLPDPPE